MARSHRHWMLRGELQSDVMAALWKLGEGTVDDVRGALPAGRKPAYNTVQTVMNRLLERGLLERDRGRHAFAYRPRVSEAEYLSQTVAERLAGATPSVRRAALLNLVGDLDEDDLGELARYVRRINRAREKR